jgi:hypothetical protein
MDDVNGYEDTTQSRTRANHTSARSFTPVMDGYGEEEDSFTPVMDGYGEEEEPIIAARSFTPVMDGYGEEEPIYAHSGPGPVRSGTSLFAVYR